MRGYPTLFLPENSTNQNENNLILSGQNENSTSLHSYQPTHEICQTPVHAIPSLQHEDLDLLLVNSRTLPQFRECFNSLHAVFPVDNSNASVPSNDSSEETFFPMNSIPIIEPEVCPNSSDENLSGLEPTKPNPSVENGFIQTIHSVINLVEEHEECLNKSFSSVSDQESWCGSPPRKFRRLRASSQGKISL